MGRKMRECSGLACLVIAFSSASFQRLGALSLEKLIA
jgi:hypothetical protein